MTLETETPAVPVSTLTKHQVKTFTHEFPNGNVIVAKVRHDDECGNGHNTFAITGEFYEETRSNGDKSITNSKGTRRWLGSCGCIHDQIAKAFPQLVPLLKWHLTSTDGPMHYIANTVYHASNRDHRGLLKGEKRQLVNGRTKQPVWERIVRNEAGEKVSIGGGSNWVDSDIRPSEELTASWEPVWVVGEGKERELDHARSSAVWPEATDEQLMLPPEELKALLIARHPALMVEFKAAVESLGFVY